MQTYKSKNVGNEIMALMQNLHKKHKNPINFLKTCWGEIAPEWAMLAEPYMIRNHVLTMKTNAAHAMILQYREQELLQIAQSVLGDVVNQVKIMKT